MYYTKYRPQKFSEISKPNDVAKALSTQIKNGNLAHAYLFVGSRGTGKTTMARLLAKAVNCQHLEDDGDPCGKCDFCLAIQGGSFLDLIEIDAASNRGIDDIRELKERIKLVPGVGKKKVYIIDEVHMLTPEAFNALLKTLEEPPAHATFILCTTEFHKVPETIRSRCQVFKFKRATLDQLTEKLKKIADKEKAKIDEQDLKKIASAAQGGFRDAETLLQQVIEGDISVEALVNLGTRKAYVDFVEILSERDAKSALHAVNKLVQDGVDLYVWLGELLKFLRDIIYIKIGTYNEEMSGLETESVLKEMQSLSNKLTVEMISKLVNSMLEVQNKVKDTFITQLPLELAIVEFCTSEGLDSKASRRFNQPSGDDNANQGGYFKVVGKPTAEKIVEEDDLHYEIVEKTIETEIVENAVVEPLTEQGAVEKTFEENQAPIIDLESITKEWRNIIKEVANTNNTVSALLKSAHLADIQGNYLILEVPYDFHKERLDSTKNREIIETTIRKVTEKELILKCSVKKSETPRIRSKETGQLTDYNLKLPAGASQRVELPEDVLEVFDGSLPF